MQIFDIPIKNKDIILALGAESAGNFSVFNKDKIYFSQDFGDLLKEADFKNFQKEILNFLHKEKLKPDVIITDLHPLMKTTLWGEKLSKKYKARHIQVQHHHAHIFSAVGKQLSKDTKNKIQVTKKYKNLSVIAEQFYGIALDGTGYGEDGRIWGGEVFQLKIIAPEVQPLARQRLDLRTIERIGCLENQMMIGGDLAIQEPARMLVSILAKILSKKEVYNFVKKYYSENEFEVLYNQLEQNFNCVETSSTGRILDAVSLLLGFCTNKRNYKHEAIDLLEVNSTKPYANIKPKIEIIKSSSIFNDQCSMLNEFSITKFSNQKYILNTTHLFEYLINNLHKDKKRLAATAQLYIAQGLYEIIQKYNTSNKINNIILSGGLSYNKIISKYFQSKKITLNKKNNPVKLLSNHGASRGDAGLSFGQIIYYLFK